MSHAVPTPDHLPRTGNCYDNALRYLLDQDRDAPELTLVHGRPTLQVEPYCQYGHAWLEYVDPSGMTMAVDVTKNPHNPLMIPAVIYRAVGNINASHCHYYSQDEARRCLVRFNHYGPWEGIDACPPLTE